MFYHLAETAIIHLTWPITVLIAIFVFKNALRKLIDSITMKIPSLSEVGPAKFQQDSSDSDVVPWTDIEKHEEKRKSESNENQKKSLTGMANFYRLDEKFPNLVYDVKGIDAEAFEDAHSYQQTTIKDLTTEDKIQLLVHNCSVLSLHNYFNRVSFNIYISQLELLRYLNVQKNFPEWPTKASLKVFYENFVKKIPNATYSFDQYISFLVTNSLIVIESEKCAISVHGVAYLSYIGKVGLAENSFREG